MNNGFISRLTVEGSIPGAGPLLRVLKQLRNEGTYFAQRLNNLRLEFFGLPRKMTVPSPLGDPKIVPSISTLNTFTLKVKCVFKFFYYIINNL